MSRGRSDFSSSADTGTGQNFALVIEAQGQSKLTVALGDFILHAEYAREGADLVLTGEDGSKVLIRDFFAGEVPPDLWTLNGSVIDGATAARLAGPLAPGQYAQATTSDGATPIGVVENAEGQVTAQHADGTRVELAEGDSVFEDDVIETGPDGAIGIRFVDDTSFAMESGGRIILDEMIFDAASGSGSASFSILQGAFVFVTGQIGHTNPENVTIKTPLATIGIRGTVFGGIQGEQLDVYFDFGAGFVQNAAGLSEIAAGQRLTVSSTTTAPGAVFEMAPGEFGATFGLGLGLMPETQFFIDERRDGAQKEGSLDSEDGPAETIEIEVPEAADAPETDAPIEAEPETPIEPEPEVPIEAEPETPIEPEVVTPWQPPMAEDGEIAPEEDALAAALGQIAPAAGGDQAFTGGTTLFGVAPTLTTAQILATTLQFTNFVFAFKNSAAFGDTGTGPTGVIVVDPFVPPPLPFVPVVPPIIDPVVVDPVVNIITGGAGNDVIVGTAGNDIIHGGSGFDIASYADATGAVTVNMAAGTVSGAGVGTDALYGIEMVRGSGSADTYTGGPPPNRDFGDVDFFEGLGGNDTINGGGDTIAVYDSATAGVVIDLNVEAGSAVGNASVGSDDLTGVFGAVGSDYADTITGGGVDNFIQGGDGVDILDGGDGFNEIGFLDIFNPAPSGVVIDLSNNTVSNDGYGNVETISNFTHVLGSTNDDTITGNGDHNELDGGPGNDTLYGGVGNDLLIGGEGFDTMDGGAGLDLFLFYHDLLRHPYYDALVEGTAMVEGTAITTNQTVAASGLQTDVVNNFVSADDGFEFSSAPIVASAAFDSILTAYDGNNSNVTSGDAFIYDGNHLIYDDDVTAAGYTVIAEVNGDAVVGSDIVTIG